MTHRISAFLRKSFRFAANVFPIQYLCGYCGHPLAEATAAHRYCPNCATPLYAADPWAHSFA